MTINGHSLLRIAAVAGAATALLLSTGVASADPVDTQPGTYPAGASAASLIAGVGSDASAEVVDRIAAAYDAQSPAPAQTLESFDAVNPQTGVAGENIQTKPGCSIARPNGANAGVSALNGNLKSTTDPTQYCIDFARSSRAKKTDGSEAGLTFWEFAPDAVTWATVGTSYAPPTPLTAQQLLSIFTCVTTDWSQVGGQPGAIHLYLLPITAGTYTFFLQAIGTDPATVTSDCQGDTNVFNAQQNDGTKLLGDPQAIVPYAVSKWSGQDNATTANVSGIKDLRGGTVLGLFNDTTAPTTTNSTLGSTYTVLNPAFATGSGRPGRFLYSVTRGGNNAANIPAFADPLFGPTGYVCKNQDQLLIPVGITPLGSNSSASHYCGQKF